MSKLDRVCTTDFADGHDAVGRDSGLVVPAAAASAEANRLQGAPGVSEDELTGYIVAAVCELVPVVRDEAQRMLLDEVLVPGVCNAAGGVAESIFAELEALISEGQAMSMRDAILDSGASQTYVTQRVVLDSAVPGTGFVKVATGRRERISESGDLGPLKGAKKVDSFARTLVSVMDVAEQVGTVEFTPKAAFVTNEIGGAKVRTQIAAATKSRLYSFDVEALENHVQRLEAAECGAAGG